MHAPRISIIAGVAALLGLCLPCCADTVSRIDLRRRGTEPVEYYVVICARESERLGAGHTFVVWVQKDPRTGDIQSQAFGFYPEAERIAGRLFVGDGAIRDESTRSASVKPWLLTHRLIVQVNRDAFEAGLNVKERWVESGTGFQLLRRNCTHFAHDVMTAIQLSAPKPALGERPSMYVGRLMTLDLGRNPTATNRTPSTLVNGQR